MVPKKRIRIAYGAGAPHSIGEGEKLGQYWVDQGTGSSFTQPFTALVVPNPMSSGSATITSERVTSTSANGEESSYQRADLKPQK